MAITERNAKGQAVRSSWHGKYVPGRPEKITEEQVQQLMLAFSMGFNDDQARMFAGADTPKGSKIPIPERTFYDYLERHPDFSQSRRFWKQHPCALAKGNIYKALLRGDVRVSQWQLEKADPEYSNKADHNVHFETLADAIYRIDQKNKEKNGNTNQEGSQSFS